MNKNQQELILDRSAIPFLQHLDNKSIYNIKKDVIPRYKSQATAYRGLNNLRSLGIARFKRGNLMINMSVVNQPLKIIEKLIPSLIALQNARRFGRYYNNSDIQFVNEFIKDKFITLDYKAWELTKFQHPSDLYIYVENVDEVASFLKEKGFSEGKRGQVVILPKIGSFSNEIERVYLDSIAKGGRSEQDAIAIELLHGHHISVKGRFATENVIKVQDDLPIEK